MRRSEDGGEAPRSTASTVRLVLLGLIVVLAVALAADNGQDVSVGWLVGSGRVPLVVALVAAFLLGALAGWLAGLRKRS